MDNCTTQVVRTFLFHLGTVTLTTLGCAQGELEHRHVKRFYARTNKVAYSIQIARKQRRRALLQAIRARDNFTPPSEERHIRKDVERAQAEARDRTRKPLQSVPPSDSYHLSVSQRSPIYIPRWLAEHDDDPATVVSMHVHLAQSQLTSS